MLGPSAASNKLLWIQDVVPAVLFRTVMGMRGLVNMPGCRMQLLCCLQYNTGFPRSTQLLLRPMHVFWSEHVLPTFQRMYIVSWGFVAVHTLCQRLCLCKTDKKGWPCFYMLCAVEGLAPKGRLALLLLLLLLLRSSSFTYKQGQAGSRRPAFYVCGLDWYVSQVVVAYK
jgi:hypothetical protein